MTENLAECLAAVKRKIHLLSKQKETPERIAELTNLSYEKDILEYDIKRLSETKSNIKSLKEMETVLKSSIAKTVKSIKGKIRL